MVIVSSLGVSRSISEYHPAKSFLLSNTMIYYDIILGNNHTEKHMLTNLSNHLYRGMEEDE